MESNIEKPKDQTNYIALAIEKQSPIETIEKMMDLQERWEKNEARKAFFDALSDFQSEKPIINNTKKVNVDLKTGGKMSYNFVPLSRIQKSVDPVLAKNGLSYRWEQEITESKYKVTCILSHRLGHSESTSLIAPSDTSGNKNTIQSIGSTISYLKRYTLECAIGISSDKDDDAQKAPSLAEINSTANLVELYDLFILKMDKIDSEENLKSIKDTLIERKTNNYKKAINYIRGL